MTVSDKLWIGVGALGLFLILLVVTPANDSSNVSSSSTSNTAQTVNVKYGSSVDVAHSRFEYLNTTGSSLVRGAWYDSSNRYMIINLNGTSYQYCRMPSSAWGKFKRATSFGTYYNRSIKGSYDCRAGGIPSYAK